MCVCVEEVRVHVCVGVCVCVTICAGVSVGAFTFLFVFVRAFLPLFTQSLWVAFFLDQAPWIHPWNVNSVRDPVPSSGSPHMDLAILLSCTEHCLHKGRRRFNYRPSLREIQTESLVSTLKVRLANKLQRPASPCVRFVCSQGIGAMLTVRYCVLQVSQHNSVRSAPT